MATKEDYNIAKTWFQSNNGTVLQPTDNQVVNLFTLCLISTLANLKVANRSIKQSPWIELNRKFMRNSKSQGRLSAKSE